MVSNFDSSMHMFAMEDGLRRAQGHALGLLGLGPAECSYRIVASGPLWRVRTYAAFDDGPAVLIVSTPIKRPYIWDLAPSASVVRYCLDRRIRIYLIEWTAPRGGNADDNAGLDEYVADIGEGVRSVAIHASITPFLMGHSLGGTFAAVFAACEPESVQGLVLLGSPLCFRRGASRFADALVSLAPSRLPETGSVPGSLLSHLSAWASPEAFVWSRLVDAVLSLADPHTSELHTRIERWALDEVPLSGKLVGQILQWFYRENRFCREVLTMRGRVVGPSCLRIPTLAVLNTSDQIVAPEFVTHFLNKMPGPHARKIEYPGEIGVCLQHLAVLVGRQAHAQIWPAIISWMADHQEVPRTKERRLIDRSQ